MDAFGGVTGSAMLLSFDIGNLTINAIANSCIGKYTPFSMIPASKADLMAILSADYYEQVLRVMGGLANKVDKEKLHNPDTLKRLYDSYMLLLRFSLVFYESKIKYDDNQLIKSSNRAELDSRAEAIAKTIDELNHCTPNPIPKLTDLSTKSDEFNKSMSNVLDEINKNQVLASLTPFPTVRTDIDDINIVAITPSTFKKYGEDTQFTVTIDYNLISKDNGIINLGFNTEKVDSFHLVKECLQVKKGSGRIIIEATVKPTEWGTANQGIDGSMNMLGEIFNGTSTAFQAYVNISEYPHLDSWNTLVDKVKEIINK